MADYTAESIDQVVVNINKIFYSKKYNAALALCKKYAELAKKNLRDSQGLAQGEGQFWTNQTTMAVRSAFGYTITDLDCVGWGLAHGMEYGEYLELANNRKHEAIRPTVQVLVPWFLDDLRKIYAD
jgi:hypothetical protein